MIKHERIDEMRYTTTKSHNNAKKKNRIFEVMSLTSKVARSSFTMSVTIVQLYTINFHRVEWISALTIFVLCCVSGRTMSERNCSTWNTDNGINPGAS